MWEIILSWSGAVTRALAWCTMIVCVELILHCFYWCSDASSRCSGGRHRCSSRKKAGDYRHDGMSSMPFIPVSVTLLLLFFLDLIKCNLFGVLLFKFFYFLLDQIFLPNIKGKLFLLAHMIYLFGTLWCSINIDM